MERRDSETSETTIPWREVSLNEEARPPGQASLVFPQFPQISVGHLHVQKRQLSGASWRPAHLEGHVAETSRFWNLAASKSPENCRFLIVATATAVLGIALMGFPSPSLFPQRNPKKPRPPRRGFFFSTLVCSPLMSAVGA